MRGATFRHSLNGAAAISVTLLFIANPPDCESEPEGESGDKRAAMIVCLAFSWFMSPFRRKTTQTTRREAVVLKSTSVLSRWGDYANLNQETEGIFFRPLLRELAVHNAVNGDGGHLQVMASSRCAWEVAFVFSIRGEARHDLVPFGNLLLNMVIAGSRGVSRSHRQSSLETSATGRCRPSQKCRCRS